MYLYLRMYICRYCPHVPKSPKMRVCRGGILCLYIRRYVPTSSSLQKWECIGVVYCFPISVCISLRTVPKSPKMRVYRGGILCPYLRMYILGYCPHVSKSPKMRVYRGGILFPYLHMYIRAYCPHVPKSPKMRVYRGGILCLNLRMYILGYCPHVPKSPKLRVYSGGILCPYIRMYIRSCCPQVPKK